MDWTTMGSDTKTTGDNVITFSKKTGDSIIIRELKKRHPLLGAKVECANIEISSEHNNFKMVFKREHEFFYNQIKKISTIQLLENFLESFIGTKLNVDVVLRDS